MGVYMITAIRRDGYDLDRRIDALEGPSFRSSIDDVIAAIWQGHEFFVSTIGNDIAYLEVKQHWQSRRWFLRTIPDGIWDNNLYSLPEMT